MPRYWQRSRAQLWLDPWRRFGDGRGMFPIRDHNPSRNVPYVTIALIAVNTAVYLAMLALFDTQMGLSRFYYDYALIPMRLSAGENTTALVTGIFIHGGFMHLAGNMLFLWIFGDNLEDEMGHLPYLLFYLVSGVGASLAQFALDPFSAVPIVGASGAIAGVMGGYLLLFPKARVDIFLFLVVFFRIFPVPAWLMLGLWFAVQIFNGLSIGTSGGVAYWAHIGGFVIGAVLTLPVWLKLGGQRFWRQTHGHPPHPEVTYGRSNIPTIRRR